MAYPRVFVSSTCYDLNEVRDSLHSFIESLYYIPVFSDKNDILYHPDIHTHESCIKEIENCNLFILIIGGRFGGEYVFDPTKSIVNVEYETAKSLNIPIYTFIKDDVYNQHKTYQDNKRLRPDLYTKMHYSSIEKQEYVQQIFEFINEVRKADKNNAIYSFQYAKQIRDILLKQFSALFYDFLWKRQKNLEAQKTNDMLSNLTVLGKKTEEIIERIYRKVDEPNAQENIDKIELEASARRFWIYMMKIFSLDLNIDNSERLQSLASVNAEEKWYEFAVRVGKFMILTSTPEPEKEVEILTHTGTKVGFVIKAIKGTKTPNEEDMYNKLEKSFAAYSKLNIDDRKKILSDLE